MWGVFSRNHDDVVVRTRRVELFDQIRSVIQDRSLIQVSFVVDFERIAVRQLGPDSA